MLDAGPERDPAAEGEAHDRGLLEIELFDEGGDVVCHRLEGHRALRRRRAAVRLQVEAYDLAVLGEEVDVGAEHLERAEAAVEQDERLALAEHLVAELDSVDANQIAFGLH